MESPTAPSIRFKFIIVVEKPQTPSATTKNRGAVV